MRIRRVPAGDALDRCFEVIEAALLHERDQLAAKAAYRIGEKTSVGLESYNGLGGGRRFGRLSEADHQTYLVLDTSLGRWDLNLGAGYGYGRPEDRWIVKAVVGVPIGPG